MRSKTSLARAAAIALAALVVYVPAMRGGVVWDDDVFLGGNSFVKPPDSLRRIWLTTERLDYFPLTDTSFWLGSRLWGADPAAHHAMNVLLHALAAILLWRVLERLRVPGAWWAALVFAVHPVNVESVAWITERKNTLSLVFCAASLLAFLKFDEKAGESKFGRLGNWEIGKLPAGHGAPAIPGGKRKEEKIPAAADNRRLNLPVSQSPNFLISQLPIHFLSVILFLLALLSKTSIVMLPVVLLLCAWWRRGKVSARDLVRTAPFFACSAALGAVTVWFQHERAMAGAALEAPGLYRSLAAAGWAVWFYISKALAPVGLCAIYPGWDSAATAGLSIGPTLLLAGCFALFWVWRRSWGRPLLFGLGCYVVMLLPVLGFVRMYVMNLSLVADRFQYPALIALIALVIGLAARGFDRAQARLNRLAPLAGAALVAVLGVHTWQQAATYKDEGALWARALERNPESWTAHNNLAAFLLRGGAARAEEALEHAREAARLKLDHAPAYYNIGRALLLLGRPEDAEAALRRAVAIWPKYADARLALAGALTQQGKLADAAEEYAKLLEAEPDFPAAPAVHNNLARILASEGKSSEAIAHYRAALAGRPDSPRILDNLAWVLACDEDARFRDGAEAVALAERAHGLSGDSDVKSLDVLAAAYAETGRFDDAVRCARKASELAASSGQAAKAEQVRKRLALYESRRPLRLGPGIPIE